MLATAARPRGDFAFLPGGGLGMRTLPSMAEIRHRVERTIVSTWRTNRVKVRSH